MKKGVLVLENGMVFKGEIHGKQSSVIGEIVFNTGMTGYQEILSDPSCSGQIITMAYPLMGNCGVNIDDFESDKSFVKGFIAREICQYPSNFRCDSTLYEYLEKQDITVLTGIDTRRLVKVLSENGTMKAVIVREDTNQKQIKEMFKKFKINNTIDEVTIKEIKKYSCKDKLAKVALIDYGVKKSIIWSLLKRRVEVDVLPASTPAESILNGGYNGVVLSNGPGNPKDYKIQIDVISHLVGEIPIFAIGMGHLLTALAMGGDTYKLKYGHRGNNHPVKDVFHDRTYITSQNHGYAVKAESLKKINAIITHVNMNDMTVEGIRYKDLSIYSVQFNPEASPGPDDTQYIFNEFVNIMLNFKSQGGVNAQNK